MKQSTIFFGSGRHVLPIIKLLNHEYDLKLVVTTEKNKEDALLHYCIQHSIPFVTVSSLKELLGISDKVQKIHAAFAVLANFGVIVTKNIIDLFPKGIINIHPSLLPLYRGPTPGQTPLVLGDVTTGVSIMLLDEEVDHGPILAKEKEPILSTDTAESLYKRLFAKGATLLIDALLKYSNGEISPQEQDHSKATYTKKLSRESGFIDDKKPLSPGLLDRLIRAYYPWPGVWTTWHMANGTKKIVKFLPSEKIQVEGKKPVSLQDFCNGYPEGEEFLEKRNLI